MTEQRRGKPIYTYTGIDFYAHDPRPEEINIHDIAQALSMTCRFGGHIAHFYSVAQHSVILSHLVDPEHAKAALLHDASEAYITDVPRPIKADIPHYDVMEGRIMAVVAERFNFAWPLPAQVAALDHRIVADEAMALFTQPPDWVAAYTPVGAEIAPVGPAAAKVLFMRRWFELNVATFEDRDNVSVEAIQYTYDNFEALLAFVGDRLRVTELGTPLILAAPEGFGADQVLNEGSWVVRTARGQLSVLKGVDFHDRYRPTLAAA